MITEHSPEFIQDDKDSVEAILKWSDAKVEWDEGIFINGAGEKKLYPQYACWGMNWKFGTISIANNYSKSTSAERARTLAALFIYLYTRGVEVSIALRCMEGYNG